MINVIGGILEFLLNTLGLLPASWGQRMVEKCFPRRPGPWG
jgi:hypothetical protein